MKTQSFGPGEPGPHKDIVTANGLFRPFALAGGRAVTTWTITSGRVVPAPGAA